MILNRGNHHVDFAGIIPRDQDSGHTGSCAVATPCSGCQTDGSDDQPCLGSTTEQPMTDTTEQSNTFHTGQ